jgi:hypothetical protein
MAADAAPERIVRVTTQDKLVGEMVFLDGKLWRRTKTLPPAIVLWAMNTFADFDWASTKYHGKMWHYKVSDYEQQLAVG